MNSRCEYKHKLKKCSSHDAESTDEDDRSNENRKYKKDKSSKRSGTRLEERYLTKKTFLHNEDYKQKEHYENFSFSKHKHELDRVFSANINLVNDIDDFWKFVNRYELFQKKLSGIDEKPSDNTLNAIDVPCLYHKLYCINFELNVSDNELFARVPPTKELTKSRLLKFKDIIILYLDFKQKEKFSKMKKLRETQKNLPVARYRDEIIDTIKKKKIVIIAGDTGCGKSTQVPQYLYSAGFKKIGIINFSFHIS